MENQAFNMLIAAGEGAAAWLGNKVIREVIVRTKSNHILNNLTKLQLGGGKGNEYEDVVVTTKLLNFVVPALIGIATGIGAVAAEASGRHDLAIGLAICAIPHFIELKTNKKIVK